jgi:predicted ArsR family transcriptional regulator
MRWWEQQIGGAAKGRLISILRRGRRTVDELAASTGVTDNAVRAQLQLLEGAGVVRVAGTRQGEGPGKPATLYEIAPNAEATLSSAYAPVLAALVDAIAERLGHAALRDLMREAGQRLESSPRAKGSLESRVEAAAALLTELGAEVEVQRRSDGWRIQGYACPLSVAVRAQSDSCRVVEELVRNVTGGSVTECCDRTEGARCRFDVRAKSA